MYHSNRIERTDWLVFCDSLGDCEKLKRTFAVTDVSTSRSHLKNLKTLKMASSCCGNVIFCERRQKNGVLTFP